MTEISEIKGIIPALVTPFDENENFDESRMRRIVEYLIEKKVDGLYLTGSTGEGFFLSADERKKVVEVVSDQVNGRIPLLVHVGAIGTKLSINYARHAEEVGVDAISSVPPFYYKYDDDSLIRYYREITESTSLPMIVYNIALAGLMDFNLMKRFAEIPGVRGVKYTGLAHFDIMRMKEEIGQDFVVYSGCDEMSVSGLTFGADGLIGSFYNLMPEIFIKINQAVKENDLFRAKEFQRQANAVILYATRRNYVGIMKRLMSLVDADGGYCRSPFYNFTSAEEDEIKKDLAEIRDKNQIVEIDFLNKL
jgi:N-acetylneuraminate lyase